MVIIYRHEEASRADESPIRMHGTDGRGMPPDCLALLNREISRDKYTEAKPANTGHYITLPILTNSFHSRATQNSIITAMSSVNALLIIRVTFYYKCL